MINYTFWHFSSKSIGHGRIPLKVPNVDFYMLGFRCICICWQHAAPNTYIANLTSHLNAMIRIHNFAFDVRFLPISADTSKTGAACCQHIKTNWIWHSILSVISAPDETIQENMTEPKIFLKSRISFREFQNYGFWGNRKTRLGIKRAIFGLQLYSSNFFFMKRGNLKSTL